MSRTSNPTPGEPTSRATPLGGVVHTYQRYDPKNFPSPTATPPDMASAAFEHMLAFGTMRHLSEEELARAIRLDPSMFPKLGPSLEALTAMLEERKRKILEKYETTTVQNLAREAFANQAAATQQGPTPKQFESLLARAICEEQISDLERFWYC